MENKYDNLAFFAKYSQMKRSQEGLEGAGEWETLRSVLPAFSQKTVLDLGCGYGWHCLYAYHHGAKAVLGIDSSQRMLEVAKKKAAGLPIVYRQMAMEDIQFAAKQFDIILSSLAIHYIKDIKPLFQGIYDCLADDGIFVFSVEHPVYTAHGSQDFIYDEAGHIQHFPVDRYFDEGIRHANFLQEDVIKYHRTLTTYLTTLLQTGFILEAVMEPQPSQALLEQPGMKDELRRPMMLIVRARKGK